MKRVLLFIMLTIFTYLFDSNSKVQAIGCTASCWFSSCTITGCSGPAACGCYFGLATCKCDEGGTTKPHSVALNQDNIRAFQTYAISSGDLNLISISGLLLSITLENYEAKLAEYRNFIENLEDSSLDLLKGYLGIE